MINEIKEKIKLNEKVYIELVDPNGLRDRGDTQEYLIQDLLDNEKLRVLGVGLGIHGNLVKVRLDISCRIVLVDEGNLVFFEMVSENTTFDDLIGISVQAVRDGVLFSAKVFEDAVYIYLDSSEYDTRNPSICVVDGLEADMETIPDIISKINALYTETFVIECEEDISKVRRGAEIVLANGSTFTATFVTQLSRGWVVDSVLGNLNQTYCLFVLNGATVTQRKTNN